MDTVEFALWLFCGLLTIVTALLVDEDQKVSIVSYICCWVALILKLINNL